MKILVWLNRVFSVKTGQAKFVGICAGRFDQTLDTQVMETVQVEMVANLFNRLGIGDQLAS